MRNPLVQMETLCSIVFIPRTKDPIFSLAIPLRPEEESSHSRKPVVPPPGLHEVQLGEEQQQPGAPHEQLSGGWFGRGCTKGTRRKKAS